MTHLILRSCVPDENAFARAVEMHAEELRNYARHSEVVSRGDAQYYPPPAALADVDASVRKSDFTPDYTLVDALPVQHGDIRALESRKEDLRAKIAEMENAAIHAVLPRGKWRLNNLLYSNAVGKSNDTRSSEDHTIINDHLLRLARVHNIQLHHAQLESQIEDLTFDNINDWIPMSYRY